MLYFVGLPQATHLEINFDYRDMFALPEANIFSPENRVSQKEKDRFETTIFRDDSCLANRRPHSWWVVEVLVGGVVEGQSDH